MGKFCKKCGAELKENVMFCGKCGTRTEVSELKFQRPTPPASKASRYSPKVKWLFCLGLQLACMALYFQPILQVEMASFFGESTVETTSILKQLSTQGSPIFYIVLLIVYLVAVLVVLLQVLQNKPLKSNSLNFLQIMACIFFGMNAIVFNSMRVEVKNESFGLAKLLPSNWGCLYIYISVAAIGFALMLSNEERNKR